MLGTSQGWGGANAPANFPSAMQSAGAGLEISSSVQGYYLNVGVDSLQQIG